MGFAFLQQDDVKSLYVKNIPEKLKLYEKYLNKKSWLAGDKVNFSIFNTPFELLCDVILGRAPCVDCFLLPGVVIVPPTSLAPHHDPIKQEAPHRPSAATCGWDSSEREGKPLPCPLSSSPGQRGQPEQPPNCD